MRRAVDAPVEVNFGQKGPVFVHAYTGEILGTGSARTRVFFRSVMEWHRWIALKDARRATGKMITGVSNLIFLFIVVSGFYLWWPRAWTWTQFRQVLWFRNGLPSKARDFNWHHVIGYWSLVPLAVIVWSGSVIGYPWASDLTYRMAGETPPRPPQGGPARAGERPAGRPEGRAQGPPESRRGAPDARERHAEGPGAAEAAVTFRPLGSLLDRAAAQSSDWTILSARLPTPREAMVQVTVDTGTGAQPQKKGTLQLDRVTGETKKWEPFEAQSKGRQWRSWMRFVHTGEYYGLVGQTIAGLVTAGAWSWSTPAWPSPGGASAPGGREPRRRVGRNRPRRTKKGWLLAESSAPFGISALGHLGTTTEIPSLSVLPAQELLGLRSVGDLQVRRVVLDLLAGIECHHAEQHHLGELGRVGKRRRRLLAAADRVDPVHLVRRRHALELLRRLWRVGGCAEQARLPPYVS